MEDLTKNKIGEETLSANINNNSGKHVFKLLLAGMFLWLSISGFHYFFTMLFEDFCFFLGIRVVLIYWIAEIGTTLVILFLLFLVLKKIETIIHKLDKVIGKLLGYLVSAYIVIYGLQFFYTIYIQVHVRLDRYDLVMAYYDLINQSLYYSIYDLVLYTVLLALSSIMIYRKKERFNV